MADQIFRGWLEIKFVVQLTCPELHKLPANGVPLCHFTGAISKVEVAHDFPLAARHVTGVSLENIGSQWLCLADELQWAPHQSRMSLLAGYGRPGSLCRGWSLEEAIY